MWLLRREFHLYFSSVTFICLVTLCVGALAAHEKSVTQAGDNMPVVEKQAEPYPVWKVPGIAHGLESYFSFDSKKLIFYGKLQEDDKNFHAYVVNVDGSGLMRINDSGEDTCSFFFPDNERVVYTSTRDNLDKPVGNWSSSRHYPQGAEIYVAHLDGSSTRRITDNDVYDAEVSVSPDGQWILFTRQIKGQLDLWRMRVDGSEQRRVAYTPALQEGGAFYMPDSETILFRAWLRADENKTNKPMEIYTMKHDGTALRRLTHDQGVNWAPYPAPDNKHFTFAKMLPPHNFEIFIMNIETRKQTRLTFNDAFDGFPSFSPDGKTISFSSSRHGRGKRRLSLFMIDVSELAITPSEFMVMNNTN